MLTGPIDEVAQPDGVLDLPKRRPRFDGEGRRLARVHSIFRPGNPAVGGSRGKVLPMVRDLPDRGEVAPGERLSGRQAAIDSERTEGQNGELVIRAL